MLTRNLFFICIILFASSINIYAQWVPTGSSVNTTNLFTGGRTGIGFTSTATAPSAMLHVVGTPSVSSAIFTGGNVGIGTTTPNASTSLSLGNNLANTKLALYDNGGSLYGIGVQSSQLRFHISAPAAKFSFLDAPAGNEIATLSGTGSLSVNANGFAPSFQFNGATTYNGATFSKILIATATNGSGTCGGCYSDQAVTNDMLFVGESNSANANLIITNHANNGSIKFSTNNNNSNLFSGDVQRMEIKSDGRVIIGVPSDFAGIPVPYPTGYNLFVSNGIITPKVKVALTGSAAWADYVFDKKYKLKSLAEVEQYIKANKHLPEVPSEADVKNNGLDVMEMNITLLKKVEELTLYMIDLKKENEKMKSEIEALKKQNNK